MRLKLSSSPEDASKVRMKLLLLFAALAEGDRVKLCCVQSPATDEEAMVTDANVSFVMSEIRLAVKSPEYSPKE